MNKQYFYLVHCDEGQTQMATEDPTLRDFLNKLNRRKAALMAMDKSFTSVTGSTKQYYPFNYGEYTNKGQSASTVMFVHGNKGKHHLKRDTDYRSIFMGDRKDIIGDKFIDYVFDTEYPSETLLRTGTEESIISQVQTYIDMAENTTESRSLKDRDLVCRIAARLLESQLNDPSSRLVLLLSAERFDERSEQILRQLYEILPPVLRTEFGFATNVTEENIASLISPENMSGCDLPIHIFTMAKGDTVTKSDTIGTYPVVYFDVEDYTQESINDDYLKMFRELTGKMDRSFESKLAYVEKLVMQQHRKSSASFSFLADEVEKMNDPETFFWTAISPETISGLQAAYEAQKDLMQEPTLEKEVYQRFVEDWLGAYADEFVQNIYTGRKQEDLAFLKLTFHLSGLFTAIDMHLKQAKLDGIEEQKKKDQEAINTLNAEKKAAEERVEKIKTESAEAFRQAQEKHEAQITSLNENIKSLNTDISRLEAEKARLNAEISKLQAENASLNDEKVRLNEAYERLNAEINALNVENRKAHAENEDLKNQLADCDTKLAELETKIQEKQSENELLHQRSKEKDAKLAEKNQQLQELNASLAQANETVQANVAEIKRLKNLVNPRVESSLIALKEENAKLQKETEKYKNQLESSEEKSKKLKIAALAAAVVAVVGIALAIILGISGAQKETLAEESISTVQEQQQPAETAQTAED